MAVPVGFREPRYDHVRIAYRLHFVDVVTVDRLVKRTAMYRRGKHNGKSQWQVCIHGLNVRGMLGIHVCWQKIMVPLLEHPVGRELSSDESINSLIMVFFENFFFKFDPNFLSKARLK